MMSVFSGPMHVCAFSHASIRTQDLIKDPYISDGLGGHSPLYAFLFMPSPLIVLCPQVSSFLEYPLLPKEGLTKCLLSGSDSSFPRKSESAGGSCSPSRNLRPYVLCSATNAASATTDFSKATVDDVTVDNPPSRGSVRTSVSSPLPLMRSAPVRCRSQSPTPRTESTSDNKFYRGSSGGAVNPCLNDEGALTVRPPTSGDAHLAP
jgi:hypothetical protein